MDDPMIDLRSPSATTCQDPMIQGNINNKNNMTTQNDTQNLGLNWVSDDEGEAKSCMVEVNALVLQEKGNPLCKKLIQGVIFRQQLIP
ncbi:hypothetical protein H5410_027725 [Solanum commersonii]|uniref:Uncharacterized protein n=1 Tax=Solanum commersonii TaxID=4109 RepID=A0A9J5YZZ8_SOLCO|nr:hypothetical protein H5410_027725 [Solanum commersonii]